MNELAIFAAVAFVTLCAIGYLKRGGYWRNQPVKRYSIFDHADGQIKQPQEVDTDSLQLTNNERWGTVTPDVLQRFLRDNYPTSYSEAYLTWILSTPGRLDVARERCNIGLINSDGELIGTITGRPLQLQLKNEIKEGFYVDFLCVRSDLRTRGYAPHLINQIIKLWKEEGLDICIFYKDSTRLPIQPITELSYWGTSNEGDEMWQVPDRYTFVPFTKANQSTAFIFFINFIHKFKVHPILTEEQFTHLFMPLENTVFTYLLYYDNQIVGLSNFIIEGNDRRNVKVVYHLTQGNNIVHDTVLLTQMAKDKVKNFYTLDIAPHHSLIRTSRAKRMDKTYFHLYNYFINATANDIAFSPH